VLVPTQSQMALCRMPQATTRAREMEQTMTLEQFLEALEKTPREGWGIGFANAIRRTSGSIYDCPLSAVAGTGHCGFPLTNGFKLGLETNLVIAIKNSADDNYQCDQELRAKLLKACGLA